MADEMYAYIETVYNNTDDSIADPRDVFTKYISTYLKKHAKQTLYCDAFLLVLFKDESMILINEKEHHSSMEVIKENRKPIYRCFFDLKKLGKPTGKIEEIMLHEMTMWPEAKHSCPADLMHTITGSARKFYCTVCGTYWNR